MWSKIWSDPFQPGGRKKIAHRFIGGLRIEMGLSPARDGRKFATDGSGFLKNWGARFRLISFVPAGLEVFCAWSQR